MKKLIYLIALVPFLLFSQSDESILLNMSKITVKMGHDAQFAEGVKMYKKCYKENDGDGNWNSWKRVQGKGNVYIFTDAMKNWAEMDDSSDPAGKACRNIIVNFVRPHIKSIDYNIASSMPKISREPMQDAKLVWVTFFKVKNGTAFNEVVNEVSIALKKIEGSERGFWYNVVGGGAYMADYFVSTPFTKFADLDTDVDSVWKVYEKVNGKKKTDAARAKFRASVLDVWSYMYSLKEELSMQ